MNWKLKVLSAAAVTSILFAGCAKQETAGSTETKKEQAEKKEEKTAEVTKEAIVQAYKDAVTELDKAKAGQEVDFDKVTTLYKENLQTLVQARDAEFTEQIDQTITAALEAGKKKEMDPIITRQLFDKLMQKELFQTLRHEFKEIDENWGKTEEVKEEYEEALTFYKVLEGTVTKRDAAYGTKMVDTINGGFSEMKTAIDKGDKLAFQLGKQVVDKTIMKTFYFATGALPNGYATKAAEEAKTDATAAKIEQAEGWAFYQAIYPYLKKNSPEEGDAILKQFDLQTDVKTLDPALVNKTFVRGWVNVALSEYKESQEMFNEDKGAITAMEGALFINMIESDLKTLIGEQETAALTASTQAYLDAAKAKDKAAADKALAEIKSVLDKVVQATK
ncbi:hypothetical protein [Ectobacillus funiculus]|uniref:Lipoprotein n=1 Tax=Ectobacillus funiculus TaxID=137993 RepID=A0ABV5WHL7_9BACI